MFPYRHDFNSGFVGFGSPEPKTAHYLTGRETRPLRCLFGLSGLLDLASSKPPSDEGGGKTEGFDGGKDNAS